MDTSPAAPFRSEALPAEQDESRRTEQELLAAVGRNDREAAEELVRRTYRPIFKALVRLAGGDGEAAADLTQEAYRKAWKGLPRFDGRCRFSTWLYRIAYTTFLNHRRRRAPLVSLDASPIPPEDPAPPHDVQLTRKDTEASLREAVLALPEELRFAITARFWGEAPVREIARREGVSTVTVRKRIRRALARLAVSLEENGS